MRRLGYERYGAQGGDIGAVVSPELGRVAPEQVVGVHVNGASALPPMPGPTTRRAELTDLERDRVARHRGVHAGRSSATSRSSRPARRPSPTGCVDSPVGQLAWIMEKFQEWTDPRPRCPRTRSTGTGCSPT